MEVLTETKYLVHTSYSPGALSEYVNKSLAAGWKLHGHISTCGHTDRGKMVIVFTQTMIKE